MVLAAWLPRGLLGLILLAGALLVLPSAQAGITGEAVYDLVSLEEAEIDVELELTGSTASQLRALADDDEDGQVSSLEAAGAEVVIGDRLEGPTDAYTLDGAAYTIERTSVAIDGLKGPVDNRDSLAVDLGLEASVQPGQGPHLFAVHGVPVDLGEDPRLSHRVLSPPDHVIVHAEGLSGEDPCQRASQPGTRNLTVELEAAQGECPRPIPAPSLASLLLGAGLAARLLATRSRNAG